MSMRIKDLMTQKIIFMSLDKKYNRFFINQTIPQYQVLKNLRKPKGKKQYNCQKIS